MGSVIAQTIGEHVYDDEHNVTCDTNTRYIKCAGPEAMFEADGAR